MKTKQILNNNNTDTLIKIGSDEAHNAGDYVVENLSDMLAFLEDLRK